jgi:hypothetical protein
MNYEITKETGTQWREQLLTMVRERREASEKASQSFRKRLPEWYNLWRGVHNSRKTPTKNDIHLPLIYSSIWSSVARKVATSFGQWPVVGFQGYGPDDAPYARKQEALVNAQFRDAELVEKEIRTFLCGDLYGTAISQVMWDHKEEIITKTNWKTLPLSQERVRQIMRAKQITFDGPNYRNVDLLDAFPQPRYTNINGNQGMQWFIVRYYLDLDQCRFMASEAGGKVFNSAEVERLARDSATMAYRAEEARMSRESTGMEPVVDRFTRPVEIVEMWGSIPYEFRSGFNGSANVVISVGNEKYLFRAEDNPNEHRMKPFLKFSPTLDPHYFYSPGKAEVIAPMAIAANRFINHQLDGADLRVHPMWMYNRNKGINTRNLFAGPGRIFGVDGDPSDALVPVPFDDRALQTGGVMTQTLWQFMQMGTGVVEDVTMGMGAGADRQTAREFMGRRESAGTRLMLESVMYEINYLEPLADMFSSLDGQLLDLPREIRILGDAAKFDTVTGAPIQNTRETVDPGDLDRRYAAKALGSTMTASRESIKADQLQIFQVLASAQPQLAGSFNMVNYLRQMLPWFNFRNVNEIIQKQPAVAEQLAGQGMTAGQMPNDAAGLAQLIGGGAASGTTSGVPAVT